MTERISREQAAMMTAQVWAQRSTCMRRNVGAVIVVGGRIISTGYNGAPAGHPHCDGMNCVEPGETGCSRAIHAEANALHYMPMGFDNVSKTMYTTESPCMACAVLIYKRHFDTLYYLHEYRLDAGIKFLLAQGTRVFRITPAGMIIRKTVREDGVLIEHIVSKREKSNEQTSQT